MSAERGPRNISFVRSFAAWAASAFYKHFVPTGLVPCALLVIICAIGVINSRAHVENSIVTQDPQVQMKIPEGLDYSKFQHSSSYHARLPCALCHRRDSNAAVPKRPGGDKHLPCAGCHAQQFAANSGPICTICHSDASSSALKPFPRLKSFNMKFDHARHVRMGGASCASCHRPTRGGVAFSIPASFSAHNTCFRCHGSGAQSGGRDISTCGTCHQQGGYVRTPQFAQSFRLGFSHEKHGKQTCNQCHQIRAGMTQRRQVTEPQPLNHHASAGVMSCQTCHNGQRAFGGDDFSACKRCHTGETWRFGR